MAPGLVPLAVWAYLDVFFDVRVHPGPPEVSPYQHNGFVLSEVPSDFAVVFGFEYRVNHRLPYILAASVVEYVAVLHGQVFGWFM